MTTTGSSYYASHFFTTQGTDNDLTHINSTDTECTGTIFLLSGTLVNTAGTAISGATIELWEADNNGIYWYVSASGGSSTNNYAGRDTAFQGYGATTTSSSGAWSFRAIHPGKYVGRIRHFHIKVDINGTNVLTTQYMFAADSASFSSDSVAASLVTAGTIGLVTLSPTTGTDSNGESVEIASNQLVVNTTVTTSSGPTITSQPASQTVSSGSSATFSVTASGSGTLSYQWYNAAGAISGATGSSYTVTNATGTGTYYVVVTDANGSTTSSTATLTVASSTSAPTITTQPASQTAAVGGSVTFSVAAVGGGTLSYQWYGNGTAIAQATSSSYTISSVTASSAGSYYVVVTNTVGSTTSNSATLTIGGPGGGGGGGMGLSITTQPTSQEATAGSTVTFSVVASSPAPITYQWYFGGTAISGATNSSYILTDVSSANAGSYYVVVSDIMGSVTSSTVTLTVDPLATAPTITTQPASQSVTLGSSVTFSVAATGTGTLSYQWYFGGTAIIGATGASYAINAATSDSAGSYDVAVTDSAGSVTSSVATLTVTIPGTAPTVTTQPVSQTAQVGSSVVFSVAASGSDTLSYQWYKGYTAISGATGASYTISGVTATDGGSYDVVITNSMGSTTSNTATLTVTYGTPVVNVTAGGDGVINAGVENGKLLFTRAGGDAASELTVYFKVKGTGTYGTDFTEKDGTVGNSVTFPAGTTKLKVKLLGLNDGTVSGQKKVNVKLVASPTGAYTIGDSSKAKFTLIDDEN